MQILLALQMIQAGAQAAELLGGHLMGLIAGDQMGFRGGTERDGPAAGKQVTPVDFELAGGGADDSIYSGSRIWNLDGRSLFRDLALFRHDQGLLGGRGLRH